MPEQRNALPFEPKGSGKGSKPASGTPRQEAIPRYVADRMARRVAVFTGLPSLAGMGVFCWQLFRRHPWHRRYRSRTHADGLRPVFPPGSGGPQRWRADRQLGSRTWISAGVRELQAEYSADEGVDPGPKAAAKAIEVLIQWRGSNLLIRRSGEHQTVAAPGFKGLGAQ